MTQYRKTTQTGKTSCKKPFCPEITTSRGTLVQWPVKVKKTILTLISLRSKFVKKESKAMISSKISSQNFWKIPLWQYLFRMRPTSYSTKTRKHLEFPKTCRPQPVSCTAP